MCEMPRNHFHLCNAMTLLLIPRDRTSNTSLQHALKHCFRLQSCGEIWNLTLPVIGSRLKSRTAQVVCFQLVALSDVGRNSPKAFTDRCGLTLHLGCHFVQLRAIIAVLLDKPPRVIGGDPMAFCEVLNLVIFATRYAQAIAAASLGFVVYHFHLRL